MPKNLPVLEVVIFGDPNGQANFDPRQLPRLTVSFDGTTYRIISGMEHLEAALVESLENLGTDYVGAVPLTVEVQSEN